MLQAQLIRTRTVKVAVLRSPGQRILCERMPLSRKWRAQCAAPTLPMNLSEPKNQQELVRSRKAFRLSACVNQSKATELANGILVAALPSAILSRRFYLSNCLVPALVPAQAMRWQGGYQRRRRSVPWNALAPCLCVCRPCRRSRSVSRAIRKTPPPPGRGPSD